MNSLMLPLTFAFYCFGNQALPTKNEPQLIKLADYQTPISLNLAVIGTDLPFEGYDQFGIEEASWNPYRSVESYPATLSDGNADNMLWSLLYVAAQTVSDFTQRRIK